MVRVERVELTSQVWKTRILTVVLHPQAMNIISNMRYNLIMRFNRLINPLKSGKIHSSGVAHAANPETFGATSPESFEQRREIDKNRKVIKPFSDSAVTRDYREQHKFHKIDSLEQIEPTATETSYGQNRQITGSRTKPTKPSRQSFNSSTIQPRTFREPPGRGFDPYS